MQLIADPLTVTVPASNFFRISKPHYKEPWFGNTGKYRFDDPDQRYGVMYAGDSIYTAFAESVLHSNSEALKAQGYVVSQSELTARVLVTFKHPEGRELELADLTGVSLKRLGLNNDVSSGKDYRPTQALSKAIRERMPHIHGIRYVSRQLNTSFCYALFGESRLEAHPMVPIPDDLIRGLCQHFNVAVLTQG